MYSALKSLVLFFFCFFFIYDIVTEQSLLEIQNLKNSLMEETRKIREKDAMIAEKLEASLLGQERERKQAEALVIQTTYFHHILRLLSARIWETTARAGEKVRFAFLLVR